MSKNCKVAVFLANLTVGGAERVTINLAKGLADRGHEVDLVVARGEGKLVSDVPSSVNLVELKIGRAPGIGILGAVPELVSYLRHQRPAAIISSLTHTNVAAITAMVVSGIETTSIVIEHLNPGTAVLSTRKRLGFELATRLYPLADEIVAVSDGVASGVASLVDIPKDDFTVIENPVVTEDLLTESKTDIDCPWFRDDETDVIISLGRLSTQKDIPTLIDAFDQLEDDGVRLGVVGQGDKFESIQADISERGLTERVWLPGYVENPFRYIQAADAFVLSSKREGLPTVLIEALACGCPVVSTDCPSGPAEVLNHGEYGSLVPVGRPDILADAIRETLDDPAHPDHLRSRAEEFTVDAAAERYERLFCSPVDSGHRLVSSQS